MSISILIISSEIQKNNILEENKTVNEKVFTCFAASNENEILNKLNESNFDYCIFTDDFINLITCSMLADIKLKYPSLNIILNSEVNNISDLFNLDFSKISQKNRSSQKLSNIILKNPICISSLKPDFNTILIVDDEEIIHKSFDVIFRGTNIKVEHSLNAEQALEKCQQDYGVIISDIKMPGTDGIELLRRIKQINQDVDVIIMTGYPSVKTVVKAQEYGAHAYITKPFEDDFLIEDMVKNSINRRIKIYNNEQLFNATNLGLIDFVYKDDVYHDLSLFKVENESIINHKFYEILDAFLLLDENGKISFSSLSFSKKSGYNFIELGSQYFTKFICKSDHEKFNNTLNYLKTQKRGYLETLSIKCKDDSKFYSIVHLMKLNNSTEQNSKIIVVLTNITHLLEQLNILKQAIDKTIYTGVIFYNVIGEVTECNLFCEQLFDMSRESILDSKLENLFITENNDIFDISDLEETGDTKVEAKAKQSDGTEIDIELHLSPINQKEEIERLAVLFVKLV